RDTGGGCAAGGIPALRREQLHHRGGDRHRRRFIGLAPSDGLPRANSAACAPKGTMRNLATVVLIFWFVALLATPPPPLKMRPVLTLDVARKIVEACIAKTQQQW